MPLQKPWDKYEAVLLLDAYIRVNEGILDRKEAIKSVSKSLRLKAQREDIEIDEIFRNEAGITFQMYSIESAFHGYTIRKPATKLFAEIAQLRASDREQYDMLLKETKKMIDTNESIEENASQEEEKTENAVTEDIKRNEEQFTFTEWMQSVGLENITIRGYVSAINRCTKEAQEHGIIDTDLLDINDVGEMKRIKAALFSIGEFSALNQYYNNRFNSAFNKLMEFRANEGGNSINIHKAVKVVSTMENNSSQKEQKTENKLKVALLLSSAEKERFETILRISFEEGLIPSAIRLDKFRMLFKDEFGYEPTQDDDLLTLQLKEAGTFVDGRIYPKQGEEQNDLLNEIRQEILDTLNEGASCVYISCVMGRWQQALSEQLNIYNETALKDMILAENMPGVYATNALFKMTQAKVYPEKDVLAFMKNSQTPVNYERLQENLWYIQMDYIKHTLVVTPSLVQVDWETYMYAPNFPVSSAELQHLVKVMKSRINEKGFLVAKDIAQLISDKCPTLAINTDGYKDWAYRNILKYLLKDYFEFGGSVVSEKGKKLEMRQVYKGFCRDYERLTFSELKQYSGEVGVQIYWDDVLTEMIRINENELIRKDLIHFDIEATDRILEEMCPGDYLPIRQVGLFLHFPAIEHPWNSYVLESYLRYSKKFKLYHVSYSENGVYGILVRRNSIFEDYRQVIIDMLANSNEWSNAKSALAFIVEKGCQARRRWTGFDKVIQEAGVRREQILMERK